MQHAERVRVAWADTDASGGIHLTAPFRWAEAAETALRRKLGLLEGWGSYPRRRVEADFRKALRFDDEVEVRIRPERVGRTSIAWAWEVLRDGEVYVHGRHVAVRVDEAGRPTPLEERELATFSDEGSG